MKIKKVFLNKDKSRWKLLENGKSEEVIFVETMTNEEINDFNRALNKSIRGL